MSEKINNLPNSSSNYEDINSAGEWDYWQSLSDVPFSGNKEGQQEIDTSQYEIKVRREGMNGTEEYVRAYFDYENTQYYFSNHERENYEMLDDKLDYLRDAYTNLTMEFPELRYITLVDKDELDGNAYFSNLYEDEMGDYGEAVFFSFSHPEDYIMPENLDEGDLKGFDNILKMLALKLGVDPQDVMHDEKLVATFVLAHEMGHAHDFYNNYLRRDPYDDSSIELRDLVRAICDSAQEREREYMALPFPGQLDMPKDVKRHVFRNRLIAMGIDSDDKEDINVATGKQYRMMPAEAYADNFAAAYVLRHYDDFFESADSATRNPDKIHPKFGVPMEMSNDAILLGLKAGTVVELTELKTDQRGYPIIRDNRVIPVDDKEYYDTFTLAKNVKRDERLSLLLGAADPTHAKPLQSSGEVAAIYAIPYREDDGNVDYQTVMAMREKNGYTFYQAKISDVTPPEVITYPDKLMARLGLREGSKVQLMKRKLNGDSLIDEASVLSGTLYRPQHWDNDDPSPIQYDHGVYLHASSGLANDDSHYLAGGNTSRVKKIFRKWKTYFIETDTSIYEVIPLPDED